jgi:hypothetical protein
MASDEKIGFLVGLLLIFGVALALNALPSDTHTASGSEQPAAVIDCDSRWQEIIDPNADVLGGEHGLAVGMRPTMPAR